MYVRYTLTNEANTHVHFNKLVTKQKYKKFKKRFQKTLGGQGPV